MTAACAVCVGRAGAHFGWCSVVGGPGHRPGTTAPAPVGTAHLGHFQAPESSFIPTGVPVLEVTSAVLCPECLGDWCEACDWSGMARPVEPEPVIEQIPGLAAAVEQWAATVLTPRSAAA